MHRSAVVCLMGPTATGKTELAVRLCERFPFDIVSVDSALVYRHMDIGTAKPDRATLDRAPHRLIDIRDPEQAYSAGEFVEDASREISDIHAQGRIPLLVGGTMLYFRALIDGIADLPTAAPSVRAQIERDAARSGWPALHERLRRLDPASAARIDASDRQRIQRALEVYEVSGMPLSRWHETSAGTSSSLDFLRLALVPADRAALHARIAGRLDTMFRQGLVDEVKALMRRPELRPDHPSMRSVGYRQVWSCLADNGDLETAHYRALVATRQLAKRQLTWLRNDGNLLTYDPIESDPTAAISASVAKWLDE